MNDQSAVRKPCVEIAGQHPSGTPVMLPPGTPRLVESRPSNELPRPAPKEEEPQSTTPPIEAAKTAGAPPHILSLFPIGEVGVTIAAHEVLTAEDTHDH